MTIWFVLIFIGLLSLSNTQYNPIWQTSPYIEAKDIIIVAGDQKTFGTYTLNINFLSTFVNPSIVLGK
jgi:hypothetical protein